MSAPVLPGLFSVDPYPMGPGSKEPGQTSAQAAQTVDAAYLRLRVLAVLSSGAMLTADEIAHLLREDRLSIRPRLSELFALGKVEKTLVTRRNASGKQARVWRVRG